MFSARPQPSCARVGALPQSRLRLGLQGSNPHARKAGVLGTCESQGRERQERERQGLERQRRATVRSVQGTHRHFRRTYLPRMRTARFHTYTDTYTHTYTFSLSLSLSPSFSPPHLPRNAPAARLTRVSRRRSPSRRGARRAERPIAAQPLPGLKRTGHACVLRENPTSEGTPRRHPARPQPARTGVGAFRPGSLPATSAASLCSLPWL